MEQQITLSLSLPETNLILEALGRLPYAQVYELIRNVQEQAQAQLGQDARVEPAPSGVMPTTGPRRDS